MKSLAELIVCLITHFIDIIVFSKIINQKIKINKKIIIFVIIVSLVDFLFVLRYNDILKPIITNLMTFLLLYYVFKKTESKTLIGTLFVYIGYVIPELIVIIIFYVILKCDDSFILTNPIGILISNIIIFILYLLLFNIKAVTKLVNRIIEWYDDKTIINSIINVLIPMILFFILMYNLSFNILTNVNDILILMLIVISMVIFISGFFKIKTYNYKLIKDNDELIQYYNIYKKEIRNKGKLLHEYNNELLMIKGIIKNNDTEEANKFINTILKKYDNTIENDWIYKLDNLPDSYINSFITLKIAEMQHDGITVLLEVDRTLCDDLIWNNAKENIEELTQILGVLLDNAKQETIKLDDRQIIIEIINNGEFIEFNISNTYSMNIDLNKISNEGFTTKGNNHGFGLSLVKDIIENNNIFYNQREINGKFFVQKIGIKK